MSGHFGIPILHHHTCPRKISLLELIICLFPYPREPIEGWDGFFVARSTNEEGRVHMLLDSVAEVQFQS